MKADTSLPPVVVTVEVALPPERAFDLFTNGLDRWWPKQTHSVAEDRVREVGIDPRVGGEIFEITDEGKGFDYTAVPDPTDAAHLELPHGRGILLMRSYADDITYNDRGNQVRLTVKLDKDCVGEESR